MKIRFLTLSPAVLPAGLVVAASVLTAGCSTTASAGSLADVQQPAQVAGQSTVVAEQSHSSSRSATEAEQGQTRQGPGSQGQPASVSAERDRVVSDAVARFVTTLPSTRLVSTQVLNETKNASAAMVVVVRNGARQVLAVSVREQDGAWTVANVDTLPSAQDAK